MCIREISIKDKPFNSPEVKTKFTQNPNLDRAGPGIYSSGFSASTTQNVLPDSRKLTSLPTFDTMLDIYILFPFMLCYFFWGLL